MGHLLTNKNDERLCKTTFDISFKQSKNAEHQIYITLDISVIFFMFFSLSTVLSSASHFIPHLCVCVCMFFFFSFSLFLCILFFLSRWLWLRLNSFSLVLHTADNIQNIKEENESVGEQKETSTRKSNKMKSQISSVPFYFVVVLGLYCIGLHSNASHHFTHTGIYV